MFICLGAACGPLITGWVSDEFVSITSVWYIYMCIIISDKVQHGGMSRSAQQAVQSKQQII